MKYVIIQGDGMADLPVAELGGRTPLEAAQTPNFDIVAGRGQIGLLQTIPAGLPPGSDVGHLSLFGYDPGTCYTGRSPLEAAALGVRLGAEDISFRLNLVVLAGSGATEIMADYSGGHIDTESAARIVASFAEALGDEELEFHPGVSYRHLMVWRGGEAGMVTTPPHDLSGQAVASHWPRGPGAGRLCSIMRATRDLLAEHPVNRERIAAGQVPISNAWIWGQGRALSIPTFQATHHLTAAVISAVDLVRGVAVCAECKIIPVPGATGFLDTNYRGKGEYALRALADHDLIFVHVEAPDEAGHMGNVAEKVGAIEAIDREIVGPLLQGLPALGPFKLLITSDHATPVTLRTHVADPVPFALATAEQLASDWPALKYGETTAAASGTCINEGHRLISYLKAYPE